MAICWPAFALRHTDALAAPHQGCGGATRLAVFLVALRDRPIAGRGSSQSVRSRGGLADGTVQKCAPSAGGQNVWCDQRSGPRSIKPTKTYQNCPNSSGLGHHCGLIDVDWLVFFQRQFCQRLPPSQHSLEQGCKSIDPSTAGLVNAFFIGGGRTHCMEWGHQGLRGGESRRREEQAMRCSLVFQT